MFDENNLRQRLIAIENGQQEEITLEEIREALRRRIQRSRGNIETSAEKKSPKKTLDISEALANLDDF